MKRRLTGGGVPERPHSQRVYFAQAQTGLVKIGCSTNIGGRLRALETETRGVLRFLGSIPGGHAIEHVWHDHFLAARAYGEWFWPDSELLRSIAEAHAWQATPPWVWAPERGKYPPMRLGRRRKQQAQGDPPPVAV